MELFDPGFSTALVLTPGPRYKISHYKTFAKGWVAQKHLLIGNYRSGVRFSKGWVRKDENLITWIGCSESESSKLTLISAQVSKQVVATVALVTVCWSYWCL